MPDVVWSVSAMTMVPTAHTAREAKYETTAGVVKFSVGESGIIEFLAPITRSLPAGRYTVNVNILRTDQREPIEGAMLLGTTASLRKRTFKGVVSTVIAMPGDNFSGAEGGAAHGSPHSYRAESGQVDIPGGIDVDRAAYWLQLKLQQEGPASEAERNAVASVRLMYYGA